MAKVMIKGTDKVAMRGTGDGPFNKEQAEAWAERANKKAEKLGIETRYEVKS